jgi:hypothetical protein
MQTTRVKSFTIFLAVVAVLQQAVNSIGGICSQIVDGNFYDLNPLMSEADIQISVADEEGVIIFNMCKYVKTRCPGFNDSFAIYRTEDLCIPLTANSPAFGFNTSILPMPNSTSNASAGVNITFEGIVPSNPDQGNQSSLYKLELNIGCTTIDNTTDPFVMIPMAITNNIAGVHSTSSKKTSFLKKGGSPRSSQQRSVRRTLQAVELVDEDGFNGEREDFANDGMSAEHQRRVVNSSKRKHLRNQQTYDVETVEKDQETAHQSSETIPSESITMRATSIDSKRKTPKITSRILASRIAEQTPTQATFRWQEGLAVYYPSNSTFVIRGWGSTACPKYSGNFFVKFFRSFSWFTAVFAILLGLIQCFYGYRLYRLTMFIVGFLFTFLFMIIFLFAIWTSPDSGNFKGIIILSFALVSALMVGFLVASFAIVGLVLSGSVLGFFVSTMLYTLLLHNVYSIPENLLLYNVALVGMVAGAVAGYEFQNVILIVSCSFTGAYLIVRGLSVFIGGFPNELELNDGGLTASSGSSAGKATSSTPLYIYSLAILVLSALGIVVQTRMKMQADIEYRGNELLRSIAHREVQSHGQELQQIPETSQEKEIDQSKEELKEQEKTPKSKT